MGNRNGDPLILAFGARHRVVDMTSHPLYSREKRGWVCPRAGLVILGKRKNILPMPEFKPQTVEPVA